jgi:hypothetical protein
VHGSEVIALLSHRRGAAEGFMLVRLMLFLTVMIGVVCARGIEATVTDPKPTARQTVEAMLANDPAAFTQLVLPEKRAMLQLGTGPGVNSTDLTKLWHCRGIPADYSDPQMPDPDYSPAKSHLVIVAFAQPCLVGFTSFTWEPQDKFVVDLRLVGQQWYVQGIIWPVTRSPHGLPEPPGTPAGPPA